MWFCSSTMGRDKSVQSSASMELILLFMLVSPCLGAVRLVGGSSRGSDGRLEVTYNGQWGTVCDDNFDVNDAKAACRSLGYTGSVPIVRPSAYYGQGSGPIWLDELRCRGSESNVFQCSHNGIGIHNCGHYEDVGVDCRPPTQIRLVGGGRPSAGRVEVNIGGRWGTVCDDAFGTSDARVVCRMLGYTSSTPRVHPITYYGRGSEPVWLDDLACSGTETNILECLTPDRVGMEDCTHNEDVGVDCLPSLRSDNLVRLVNRSRKSEGRVEVYYGGRWGTVCDDRFGVDDATVVCRMLGYTGVQSPTYQCCSFYGRGSDPIWLDDLTCGGHESSIFSCSHNAVGTHNCNHNEDVGVDCRPPSGPTTVSISGPVYHITDGTKPLTLTCTAYDFTASVSFTWRGVHCSRRVTSAEYNSCTFTPSTYTNGNIVTCIANNTEKADLFASDSYTLRLTYPPRSSPVITGIAGGDSLVEGSNLTLTCSINGGRPHVTEVSIVCEGQGRTLTSPARYTVSGTTVSNSIDINLLRLEDDGMKCNCSGNWTTQPNLYSRQTSTTIRVVRSDSLIRLSGRSRRSEGRVEVYRGGRWGTVCDDWFDVDAARVVCRMLGYTSEPHPIVRASAYYGRGTGPILLDDVRCQGHESSIFSCSIDYSTSDCSHSEDVGVDCRPPRGPSRVSISGPFYHITDGSKPLTLNCTAEDFTASVSFAWTGVHCSSTVTSAEYNTCIFTPSITANGNTVRCTVRNTENTTLTASDSYIIRLNYPPTSSPVISGFAIGDSVVEGSHLTLTCSISGGTPHVTEVSIVCEGQGRTLTSPAHYTVSGTTVSNSIDINLLRMEDDGMKCNCSGNWTTQPNLYSRKTSTTIRVVPAVKPNIGSLTLNGEQQSVAVNESDSTSVILRCTASGRPKPSIRVVRVDTGRPLERYTTRRSGQDENVQQYTLTTSARCQDAAIYRCEASNRVGSDEENVTLFVNCAPNLVDDNSLGNLERPLILNKSLEQRESARASLHLLVYPSPSLLHVAYVGPNITSNDTEHEGEEIDSNSFLFQCQASDVLYDQVCSISVLNEKVLDAGFYRLTVGNVAGDFSFYVKLNVHAVTEKESDAGDSSKTRTLILGAGIGGGVVLIIVVVVVVVVVLIRRCTTGTPTYESPAFKRQVRNPGYTDLSMTQISRRVQCEEAVYDNAALDSDNATENPYVNVTAVNVSRGRGAAGGKGRVNVVQLEATSGGDAVYENTVLC